MRNAVRSFHPLTNAQHLKVLQPSPPPATTSLTRGGDSPTPQALQSLDAELAGENGGDDMVDDVSEAFAHQACIVVEMCRSYSVTARPRAVCLVACKCRDASDRPSSSHCVRSCFQKEPHCVFRFVDACEPKRVTSDGVCWCLGQTHYEEAMLHAQVYDEIIRCLPTHPPAARRDCHCQAFQLGDGPL